MSSDVAPSLLQPETVFTVVLPSIAERIGDFSTFALGEIAENAMETKCHLARRVVEAAIWREGGNLTEAKEVAQSGKMPEHKLRQASTEVLLKMFGRDSVPESGVRFQLIKHLPNNYYRWHSRL